MRKNKFQKKLMILILSFGITSLLLKMTKLVGNHLQEKQLNHLSAFQKSHHMKEATLKHFFSISPQTISCTEAVYDMVRKIYERPSDDLMEDLDVNMAIWRVFVNATLKATFHLGSYLDVILRLVKNSFWRSTGQLFGETENLISGRTETSGKSLIDSEDLRWTSTSLLHRRAYHCANAKVYVFFSDSVLCLRKKGHNLVESWKKQIQWYSETSYFSELNRTDGKPMEFEWNMFPGFTIAGILNEILKMMGGLQCDPADFKGRIIFMSMFNDIVWDAKGKGKLCESNSKKKELKDTLQDFFAVVGLSWDLAQKRSGTPRTRANQTDAGIGLLRKSCKISKDLVTQFSVVPVPWREDN